MYRIALVQCEGYPFDFFVTWGRGEGEILSHHVVSTQCAEGLREREESFANFPDQNVQCHSVTSLETARSLTNSPSWGVLRKKCVFIQRSPWNCSVSYLSFVYGRSLWAELNGRKILFIGRQTCSVYLVLWLWLNLTKPNLTWPTLT